MATLTNTFLLFTIQILIMVTSSEADPQIEVHPSKIMLGISSSLDISCSFSSTNHPEIAEFASLVLSKANSSGQNFEDLAAITRFSPNSATILTQEKVSATGVYSQTGESFIQLTWEFPTDTQAGVYHCVAHGLDLLGDLIESVNSSTVIVAQAGLNDVIEKLMQMQIREMNMEKHIGALEYNNSQMSSYITDHDHTLADMEKNIQDLQHNNSLMSSYITHLENTVAGMEKQVQALEYNKSYTTDLDDIVASLQPIVGLNLLGTYQNKDYYISSVPYGRIDVAMVVCKSHGGYLVEIDNEDEFNAVKGFLNNTSGFDYAVIAGTDEASDGTWILQSNNKPLPFTSWLNSASSTGRGNDCLALVRGPWDMDDYGCYIDPPHYDFRFTCEIPRV